MGLLHDFSRRAWDVLVVGTGMGGATFGYALARGGKKVLFLERGLDYASPLRLKGHFGEAFIESYEKPNLGHREILLRAGRYPDVLFDQTVGSSYIPFMGAGAGGSSALYGMVMERFRPCDFEPKKNFPHLTDTTLPDRWPITHGQMQPYYDYAERLFRVPALSECPALSSSHQEMMHALAEKGLNPYRLRPACDFLPDCQFCQAYLCPRECKNDAGKICLLPSLAQYSACLIDQCEVIRLVATAERVTAVECQRGSERAAFRASLIVLAAGALETPRLLLASASPEWPQGLANDSGCVGRNLMRHFVDIYGMRTAARPARRGNLKSIGVADFYLCSDGEKLGVFQSFGDMPPAEVVVEELVDRVQRRVRVPNLLLQTIRPHLYRWMDLYLGERTFFASILEDLPYADNRVSLPPKNLREERLYLTYRVRPEGKKRIREFRKRLTGALRPYRPLLIKLAEKNEELAHVTGTCRFGDDPATSVLNPSNRAHALENLYIVDGSFLPSSGGTNPALTIGANALRVADCLLGEGTVGKWFESELKKVA